MTLFDPPVSPHLLWPISAPGPKRRARALLSRFQERFPELLYDMDLEVDLANAQAFLEGKQKRVRLYGGLIRHRKIGLAGLALALAHETGHHLAGAPYMRSHRWLSSESRSTQWGIEVALPAIFSVAVSLLIVEIGKRELATLGWPLRTNGAK